MRLTMTPVPSSLRARFARVPRSLLIVACSLVLIGAGMVYVGATAPAGSPRGLHAQSAENEVQLYLDPTNSGVEIGSLFSVTVRIATGEDEVDAVGAFIRFDPAVLQVDSVAPAGPLDIELENIFDNQAGTISYQAGRLETPFPQGDFPLATIGFQAIGLASNTELLFDQEPPLRMSGALRAGETLTANLVNGVVTVSDPPTATPTPTATNTDTPLPTETPTLAPTATGEPDATATPTNTPTDTPAPTSTPTSTTPATPTSTTPATATTEPAPTDTPEPEPQATPVPGPPKLYLPLVPRS